MTCGLEGRRQGGRKEGGRLPVNLLFLIIVTTFGGERWKEGRREGRRAVKMGRCTR